MFIKKDSHIFLFKFISELAMNKVLSQGTWYVEGQPMLLKAWGRAAKEVDSIPLWVKFSKIPDCYWTQKGLSWLGSTIGRPLCADELTSKLEVLPFAKMCVEYKIGDEIPNKIEVESLDPVSEEISVVEVQVQYPFKHLVCWGCRALGHKVGACPTTRRVWVMKEKQANNVDERMNVDQEVNCNPASNQGQMVNEEVTPLKEATVATHGKCLAHDQVCNETSGVNSTIEESSPSPAATFKNLKNVDEIDSKRAAAAANVKQLSKSQKKRRRKAQGSPPSH